MCLLVLYLARMEKKLLPHHLIEQLKYGMLLPAIWSQILKGIPTRLPMRSLVLMVKKSLLPLEIIPLKSGKQLQDNSLAF